MVMQDQLILYLGHTLSEVSWVILRGGSLVKECNYLDHSDILASDAKDKQIIVFVPAEDVVLTSVSLPHVRGSRLQQAIPFALEEQLIPDLETLHFAYAKKEVTSTLPVLVVAKEKMQQWLSLLSSWHIQPDILTPLIFALPTAENRWYILIHELIIVRSNIAQGFFCDKSILAQSLTATDLTALPNELIVYNFSRESYAEELKKIAERSWINSSIEISEEMIPASNMLAHLSPLTEEPVINLLQGEFASKKSNFPRREKIWKAVVCLGCSCLLVLFLYPIIPYFVLKPRLTQLNEEISQIYQYHFPNAKSIVAPKLRMTEKLQKLSTQFGENRLLTWLTQIAQAQRQSPNIHLKRLDFQNNQLSLDVIGANSEDVSNFTELLQQAGLRVKQQSANLAGNHMNAILTIE